MSPRLLPPLSTREDNRIAAFESLISAFAFATMSASVFAFSEHIAWPVVAFVRVFSTFVAALIILRITRTRALFPGPRRLWLRSSIGAIGLMCTFYALTHMHPTDASAIIATNPIWVMVILGVGFRHRASGFMIFAVGLAVAGVFVMKRPSFDASSIPLLVAFAAAFVQASVKVTLSFLRGLNSVAIVAHYAMVGSIITLALSLGFVDHIKLDDETDWTLWLWLIPVGVFGTLAQITMTSAYKRGSTTLVALIGLANIPIVAVYDTVLWHRRFDTFDILGLGMIFTAIALSIRHNAKGA